MGGDGDVRHNAIKQFTPHKNEESLNEAKRPEPDYKQLVKLLIMAFKHEPKARFYFNRNNGVVYFDLIGGAAYSPKKSKMRDIFGGMNPIAVNREFGRADHYEEETIKQVEQLSNGKIKAEIKELGDGVLYKLKDVDQLEEMDFNDPIAMRLRANKMKREKETAKPKRRPLYGKQRQKVEDALLYIDQELKGLYSDKKYTLIDMEQEAEPEGGPIADRYGDELNKIENQIQALIAKRDKLEARLDESLEEAKKYKKGDKLKVKLKNGKEFDITFDSYSSNKGIAYGKIDGDRKPFSLDAVVSEAAVPKLNEAKGDQIAVGNYVKTQDGDIYKRVEGTVGGSPAFVRVEDGKEGKRKTGLHDTVKLTLVNKGELEKSVKENSHFEKRLAKMAADEKEKRAKSPSYAAASKLDVDIEDFIEKGQSYGEFKKRLDKLKENKKLTYSDFVDMVRADMKAGAASDENASKNQIERVARWKYDDYLKGTSVDDLFEATKKEYDALLDKEHELTKAYSKDKTDANWKKLSAIRKKGKKLEKELEDQGLLEASKGALNYFNDLKYYYQKAFRYLDVEEREEYKQLAKDFFSRLQIDDKVRAVGLNEKKEMEEYNSGIYYHPDKEKYAVKAKQASKSGLEKVRDFVKKVMKEEEITVDDATEFKLNLKHLLDKHVVKSEALSDFEEEDVNYDELYSDYKYKVNEAKPKKGHGEKISKEVFAKLKGKTISYKGTDYKVVDSDEAVLTLKDEDDKSKTINLRQFNVSGMIEEILETIELGKQLEEGKLCPKGEAYRKRRMAAGEKSSAYLSGRAVKVCKGQMSGKKKK